MRNIRDWESRRTHLAWGTGSGNPALMVLACLVANLITLVLGIAFALAVTGDGYNDYSSGLGLVMMLPAPAAGLLWALIDVAVLHYWMLHPIHYLVEASLLMALNVSLGVVTSMLYSWDEVAWLPGLFMLAVAVGYIGIMFISGRLVHKRRTRPQSAGIA